MTPQRTRNHILMPCDVIYIYRMCQRFGCDIFYVNGVGFHSYFGYGKAVIAQLNGKGFISAFADRAKELGKFCKRFNYRQLLIPN